MKGEKVKRIVIGEGFPHYRMSEAEPNKKALGIQLLNSAGFCLPIRPLYKGKLIRLVAEIVNAKG